MDCIRDKLEAELKDSNANIGSLLNQLKIKLNHLILRLDTPDANVVQHIMMYAQYRHELFRDSDILPILKQILHTSNCSVKRQSLQTSDSIFGISAHILFLLYKNEKEWPIEFLEMYLEDALGSRLWVDSERAQEFVKNVLSWRLFLDKSNHLKSIEIPNRFELSMREIRELVLSLLFSKAHNITGAQNISSIFDTFECYLPSSFNSNNKIASEKSDGVMQNYLFKTLNNVQHSVLLQTLASFCSFLEIRLLMSLCLEKIVGLSAVTELSKRMLSSLISYIRPTSSGSFLPGDIFVIECLVRFRHKVNTGLKDVLFRSVYGQLIKSCAVSSVHIFFTILSDDIQNGSVKTDSLQLITQLLQQFMNDESPIGRLDIREMELAEALRQSTLKRRYSQASSFLGRSIALMVQQQIMKSTTRADTDRMWIKYVVDAIFRILSSLGYSEIDYLSFLKAVLPIGSGSNIFPTSKDKVVDSFALGLEMCQCCQILAISDTLIAEKDPVSTATQPNKTNSRLQNSPPSSSTPRHSGGLLRDPPSQSHFLKSNFLRDDQSSSILRADPTRSSSSSSNSKNGRMPLSFRRTLGFLNVLVVQEYYLEWCRWQFALIIQIEVEPRYSGKLEFSRYPMLTTSLWFDTLFDSLVDIFQKCLFLTPYKGLLTPEKMVMISLRDRSYFSSSLLLSLCQLTGMLSSKEDHTFSFLTMMESLIQRSLSTSSLLFPKNQSFPTILIHDSSKVISHLCSLSYLSLFTTRSQINRFSLQNLAIFCDDSTSANEYVGNIRHLSSETSSSSHRKRSKSDFFVRRALQKRSLLLGTLSSSARDISKEHEAPESSSPFVEYLPHLVHRGIYWKVCVLLYLLGCVDTSALGEYLWTRFPNVQVLMLMSMSSRFFYPPQAISLSTLDSVEVGSNRCHFQNSGNSLDDSEQAISTLSNNLYHDLKLPDHLCRFFDHQYSTEMIISSQGPEVLRGKVLKVESALKSLESQIGNFLFSCQPAIPTASSSSINTRSQRTNRDPNFIYYDENENELFNVADNRFKLRQERESRALLRSQRYENNNLEERGSQGIENKEDESSGDDWDSSHLYQALVTALKKSNLYSSGYYDEETFDDFEDIELASERLLSLSAKPHNSNSTSALDIQVLNMFIPWLTSSCVDPFVTQFGSNFNISNVMFAQTIGAGRQPPPEIIEEILTYERQFAFGSKLRNSTEPDFIVEAISEKSSSDANMSSMEMLVDNDDLKARNISRDSFERSIDWLLPAICADIKGVLSRLPILANIHLIVIVISKIFHFLEGFQLWSVEYSCRDQKYKDLSAHEASIQLFSDDTIMVDILQSPEMMEYFRLLFTVLLDTIIFVFDEPITSKKVLEQKLDIIRAVSKDLTSCVASYRISARYFFGFFNRIWSVFHEHDSCMYLKELLETSIEKVELDSSNWISNLKIFANAWQQCSQRESLENSTLISKIIVYFALPVYRWNPVLALHDCGDPFPSSFLSPQMTFKPFVDNLLGSQIENRDVISSQSYQEMLWKTIQQDLLDSLEIELNPLLQLEISQCFLQFSQLPELALISDSLWIKAITVMFSNKSLIFSISNIALLFPSTLCLKYITLLEDSLFQSKEQVWWLESPSLIMDTNRYYSIPNLLAICIDLTCIESLINLLLFSLNILKNEDAFNRIFSFLSVVLTGVKQLPSSSYDAILDAWPQMKDGSSLSLVLNSSFQGLRFAGNLHLIWNLVSYFPPSSLLALLSTQTEYSDSTLLVSFVLLGQFIRMNHVTASTMTGKEFWGKDVECSSFCSALYDVFHSDDKISVLSYNFETFETLMPKFEGISIGVDSEHLILAYEAMYQLFRSCNMDTEKNVVKVLSHTPLLSVSNMDDQCGDVVDLKSPISVSVGQILIFWTEINNNITPSSIAALPETIANSLLHLWKLLFDTESLNGNRADLSIVLTSLYDEICQSRTVQLLDSVGSFGALLGSFVACGWKNQYLSELSISHITTQWLTMLYPFQNRACNEFILEFNSELLSSISLSWKTSNVERSVSNIANDWGSFGQLTQGLIDFVTVNSTSLESKVFFSLSYSLLALLVRLGDDLEVDSILSRSSREKECCLPTTTHISLNKDSLSVVLLTIFEVLLSFDYIWQLVAKRNDSHASMRYYCCLETSSFASYYHHGDKASISMSRSFLVHSMERIRNFLVKLMTLDSFVGIFWLRMSLCRSSETSLKLLTSFWNTKISPISSENTLPSLDIHYSMDQWQLIEQNENTLQALLRDVLAAHSPITSCLGILYSVAISKDFEHQWLNRMAQYQSNLDLEDSIFIQVALSGISVIRYGLYLAYQRNYKVFADYFCADSSFFPTVEITEEYQIGSESVRLESVERQSSQSFGGVVPKKMKRSGNSEKKLKSSDDLSRVDTSRKISICDMLNSFMFEEFSLNVILHRSGFFPLSWISDIPEVISTRWICLLNSSAIFRSVKIDLNDSDESITNTDIEQWFSSENSMVERITKLYPVLALQFLREAERSLNQNKVNDTIANMLTNKLYIWNGKLVDSSGLWIEVISSILSQLTSTFSSHPLSKLIISDQGQSITGMFELATELRNISTRTGA